MPPPPPPPPSKSLTPSPHSLSPHSCLHLTCTLRPCVMCPAIHSFGWRACLSEGGLPPPPPPPASPSPRLPLPAPPRISPLWHPSPGTAPPALCGLVGARPIPSSVPRSCVPCSPRSDHPHACMLNAMLCQDSDRDDASFRTQLLCAASSLGNILHAPPCCPLCAANGKRVRTGRLRACLHGGWSAARERAQSAPLSDGWCTHVGLLFPAACVGWNPTQNLILCP